MNRDAIDSRLRELVIDDPMEELRVFVPLNRPFYFSLLLKVLEFAFEVDGMVVRIIKLESIKFELDMLVESVNSALKRVEELLNGINNGSVS
nr:paired amphipathic helix protein Sin3-like 5 [Tanacetum cinerariifolium]